jgi:hypothetical protein
VQSWVPLSEWAFLVLHSLVLLHRDEPRRYKALQYRGHLFRGEAECPHQLGNVERERLSHRRVRLGGKPLS